MTRASDVDRLAGKLPAGDMRAFRRAGILLLLLVLSFATLVPGGPIETRDFSHLGGTVFWGFNAFLIMLAGLAGVSAVGLLRGNAIAGWGAVISAWGYLFVVFLDLGHVFPVSPDAIPLALGLVEILDAMLAAFVLALVHRGFGHI